MDKQTMNDEELYHEILNVDRMTEELYEQVLDRCHIEHCSKPDRKPRNDEERSEEGPGAGIGFERIRRITGYLVGDVSRWNDGKKSELNDRVKHK
jgi:anaerobic ribonucleoside-triphosphate reductase